MNWLEVLGIIFLTLISLGIICLIPMLLFSKRVGNDIKNRNNE